MPEPDEGGEDENEEMEEEQEEEANPEEQPEAQAVIAQTEQLVQMCVAPQTSDPDKKASDVLFDSDDGEGQNNAANQK